MQDGCCPRVGLHDDDSGTLNVQLNTSGPPIWRVPLVDRLCSYNMRSKQNLQRKTYIKSESLIDKDTRITSTEV